MARKLVGKYQSTQEQWIQAYDDPYGSGLTPEKLNQLEEDSINFMKKEIEGKVACGHSYGKDSLVLYDLYKRAGYKVGIHATSIFQFPSMSDYKRRSNEQDVIELISPKDWNWLNKVGEFSTDLADVDKKHATLHRNPINRYIEKEKYDTYVVGRRVDDGNNIPKSRIMRRGKNHVTKVISPIADWSQEAILAYLQKYDIELPKPYFMPNYGFHNGSNPWIMIRPVNKTSLEVWRELYLYEPEILETAQIYYDEAKQVISENNGGF